ncbi:hypothetical protein Tco_0109358 [Tanacetum coccineum]
MSKFLRGSPDSVNQPLPIRIVAPCGIYQPGWGVTNNCRLDTLEACQDMVDHTVPLRYFSELFHLPNTKVLGQYNMNLARKVAMGSQLMLRFEQEVRLLKEARAKIARRDQRIQNLETLLEAKVDMKKVAEAKNANLDKETESLPRPDFPTSKLITNQLSRQVSTFNHSAEIDARLDALSIDFDDELTGGGRQVFDDVCSLDSKGKELRDSNMGFEAREAKLDLEAFDYETSPYLLCQLKRRPVYPEVRYLKDPWSIKEEILLEDAIAANISCAEKKKKCRVVCRTHGVGSAHHARSDDIPVLIPSIYRFPQGLLPPSCGCCYIDRYMNMRHL